MPKSNQGPHNLDTIFKSMNLADRSQILEKIHNMRMREVEAKEPSKPNLPQMTGGEKDKLMAQYYSAKRQIQKQWSLQYNNLFTITSNLS